MPVSLKNMSVKADELRARLQSEQEEKQKKAEKQNKPFEDNKFRPELIGLKTNYVIRVLPHLFVDEGQSAPWVNTFVHIFHNPNGQKRFVLCPRTAGIGGTKTTPCPLCEKSRVLYDKVNAKTASKAEEELAGKFYHKPRYFVNVLVIEDPRPAEKNQKDKVLIYELGPQLFEKFKETLIDQKKNFHDPINGYNFNLVVKKKGEYVNYESSHFCESTSPVATTDSEFERITKCIHDLNKFCFGKQAKSYEEIKLIMEGKEPPKVERTWDSRNPGVTTERTMGRSDIDNNVVLPETPVATEVPVVAIAPKRLSDEELLNSLDELGT